jgi:hypothetical protein
VKVQSDRPQAGSVAEGGGNASLGVEGGEGVVTGGCCVVAEVGAGQGAHREVGSEGFEAKHRAVAEIGEPVGPIQAIPSLHYGGEGNTWGTWTQQGVCGRRGGKALCVTPGDLVRSRSTEWGSWAYKPRGEVAGDVVREVGVTRGTAEPRNNRNLGIAAFERRRPGGSKGAGFGEGVTVDMANRACIERVGGFGLMVAEAMTEPGQPRILSVTWRGVG